MPFVDKVRYMIDLREQVVSFPPQPVITEDNLVVSIDTVIYFQVTDPVAATYEIANYIQAIEQLTMTTLRNIVGGMDLEQTLTSRDEINNRLRGVLDEATGKWGIRVNRVELKGIDPPPSIKDSMEKQMRADRDKRAAILTAEGQRQSAILTAEGDKQAAILNAEGDRESLILRAQADREAAILKAQGEGQAIQTVFQAIHDGQPGPVAAGLPVPPDDAEDRRGRRQQGVDRAREITKALEGLGSDDERARRASPTRSTARAPASTWARPSRTCPRTPTLEDHATRRSRTAIAAAEESAHPARQPRDATGDPPAARPLTRVTPGRRRRRSEPSARCVAILLAGMAAGTINTVVGSGTLITFPTLLAFGIPPVTANVSNTDRPGARVAVRGDRLPARAGRPAAAAGPARHRLRARRHHRGGAAAGAARVRVPRDRAGADRAGLRAGGLPADDQRRVAARAEARGVERARARRLRGCGCWCSSPGCTAATSAPPRACC